MKENKNRLKGSKTKVKKSLSQSQDQPNHPAIVWGACYLWVISLFAIVWALSLFFCIPDWLAIFGLDIVNGFVLLSGFIMLPTNVYLLYNISKGITLDHKGKVVCCPLWLCIGWIIVVNLVGASLCIQRISCCQVVISKALANGLQHYRDTSRSRRFMDSLQWTLKCCGIKSYKDWFTSNWYDKVRDYELDPTMNIRYHSSLTKNPTTDSVPLSCCKTGSCIPNFLMEMGTKSINTNGCFKMAIRMILIGLIAHLFMFITVVFVEVALLGCIMNQCKESNAPMKPRGIYDVRNIMSVKHNFDPSSVSYQQDSRDSEDTECMKEVEKHN